MTAKKTAKKTVGRPFTGKGDPRNGVGKKGASGRPASEVKAALLAGFSAALPELLRLSRQAKSEGDRIRALDVLGKYAGLTSVELDIVRPVSLLIEGLE